jgi:hypothetical protein
LGFGVWGMWVWVWGFGSRTGVRGVEREGEGGGERREGGGEREGARDHDVEVEANDRRVDVESKVAHRPRGDMQQDRLLVASRPLPACRLGGGGGGDDIVRQREGIEVRGVVGAAGIDDLQPLDFVVARALLRDSLSVRSNFHVHVALVVRKHLRAFRRSGVGIRV